MNEVTQEQANRILSLIADSMEQGDDFPKTGRFPARNM